MAIPVKKMPLIPISIDYTLRSPIEQYRQRLDSVAWLNRNIDGSLVIQTPAIGQQSTENFSVDRMTFYSDGRTILAGSLLLPSRLVTATVYAQTTDFAIFCDATAGALSVCLPAANTVNGMVLVVKKIDAAANNVTITTYGTELIDGATTNAFNTQWTGRIIQSSGTAWYILANI